MISYKKNRFMPQVIMLLLLVVVSSSPLRAQANREFMDVKSYSFTLELNDTTDQISGVASIQAITKKETQTLELDFATQNSSGKGMQVQRVTLKETTLVFEQANNLLRITLPATFKANAFVSLKILYRGIPADGLIISKNKFGDRTFFGDNWPNRAQHWLPVIDHPSDKAKVEFTVLAPHHYSVIGNGKQVEESYVNANQKLTRWQEDVEIATKVMVIGVARFATYQHGETNQIPVTSWVYPQTKTIGFTAYNTASRILDFFSDHIAPYPYEKLANVQSKTIYGGMENAGNIFYYENSVSDEQSSVKNESLVAHEIAHQWFGNSASESDWHHVWLSEGFATYFTHLYTEFTYGRDKMTADLREDRQTILNFYKQQKLPIVFEVLPNELISILSPNSYQKASWVLHMLRKEVGEEAFWTGVRLYYSTYKNSNARTEDFTRIMEQTSGKNLTSFFNQWLHRPGQPTLHVHWTYDSKAETTNLTIHQVQVEEAFNVPLEIGFFDESNNLIGLEKIALINKKGTFSFKMDKKPAKVLLDPYTNLLFDEKL